jgi:hypothetical protein
MERRRLKALVHEPLNYAQASAANSDYDNRNALNYGNLGLFLRFPISRV